MAEFSKDRDILKYEPVLFGELHLPSQVLSSGSDGVLDGTSFTSTSADFVSSQMAEGGVIYLSSSEEFTGGAFEIVSVDSANELSISVLRADAADEAIASPVGGSDLAYRVSTFAPQAREVGGQLLEYFGFGRDGEKKITEEDILNPSVLRRVSAFAVISSVYSLLAAEGSDEGLWKKSRYYRRRFEKCRERCSLAVDIDGDEVTDVTKSYGVLYLKRG